MRFMFHVARSLSICVHGVYVEPSVSHQEIEKTLCYFQAAGCCDVNSM